MNLNSNEANDTEHLLRCIAGHRTRRNDRPCLLLVGHQAGQQLGGGERSLIDLLDAFDSISFNIVVAIPSLGNEEYVEAVRARSLSVYSVPVTVGENGYERTSTVEQYAAIISECGIDAVHTNTIVPRASLLAARRAGIPAVVHAREIPYNDPDLCKWLGASAEELVGFVMAEADHVIANSKATANAYPLSGRTSVVPNFVDVRHFEITRPTDSAVRVGLVSSNSYKKGQLAFIKLARMLEHRVDVSFVIIGPKPVTEGPLSGTVVLPGNVRSVGYLDNPVDVMAEVDILLNLSTCDESFGRTTLEAMAACLPVVAFARGAMKELIRHGQNGFLVPTDDLAALARRVEQLVRDPLLRDAMGQAGRQIAKTQYSREVASAALRNSYRFILPDSAVREQSANDMIVSFPSINNSQFKEPFYIGNRARFAHCSAVKFIDSSLFVAVSLIGQRLYLVRFDADGGSGEIVTTLHTTNGLRDVSVDLIDYDGAGRIITANCEHSSLTIYRLTGDRIELEDVVIVGESESRYCHGAKFVPGRPDLVCASVTTGRPEVVFLSLETRLQVDAFVDEGWMPKDVTFIDDRRMAVVSMQQNVGQDPRVLHQTKVALVTLDFDGRGHRITDEMVIPNATADGCHLHQGKLMIVNQADDAVMTFEIHEGRLRRLADMAGFSFPHGVDVSPDGRFMAVANYGTNTISIRRLLGICF